MEFTIWGRDRLTFRPVLSRLKSLGLTPEDSRKTVGLIALWLKCNGPNGYLENVARQGTAWKQVFSGDFKEIPGCTRTKENFPVRTLYLRKYKVSVVLRVMKFMKNLITFKQISSSQWQKFYNSATRQRSPRESLRDYGLVVKRGADSAQHKDECSWDVPEPITEFVNSKVGKKTFSPFDTRYSVPRQPLTVVIDSLKALGSTNIFNMVDLLPFVEAKSERTKPLSAGMIGCTQEPGGKARFFVSVHPAYQAMFVPLQRALKYRAKRDKCSYAFNQDAGRRAVQKALRAGKTVFSFDLSDATNNYPLYLQSCWMYSSMIDPSQVTSFEEVSRLPYMTSQEIYDMFGVETVTYTNGQPLGLLPSAMAFHLSHIYLLRGLEIDLYGKARNNFAVVIDDVAIWDEPLALAYRKAMSDLEVPISEGKSFASNKAAEFLGRFITPSQIIEMTRQVPVSLNNVVSYAKVFGSHIIDELHTTPRKKVLLKALCALPSYVGGADTGNGLSLSDRFNDEKVRPWLQAMSNRRRSLSNQYDPNLYTDRVRVLVSAIRGAGHELVPELSNYLFEVLPRFRAILPAVWYVNTNGQVITGKETASSQKLYMADPTKGMLIREDTLFSDIQELQRSESFRPQYLEEKSENLKALRAFLNAVGSPP